MRPVLLAPALLALSLSAAIAAEATASYVITLGGLNVASARITLAEDGSRYAIDLDADVVGVGNLVTRGTARASTGGAVNGGKLSPESFRLETIASGESFTVSVQYGGGNATGFVVDPPFANDYGRVPLERAHLRTVTDMLSAFLVKGGSLDASLCDRRAKVFTGVERFDISMSFVSEDVATSKRTGYQGPVVLCALRYVPISGHYAQSDLTRGLAESDRILLWYAPLADTGYFIPYRALITTTMGDLSLVLTRLNG